MSRFRQVVITAALLLASSCASDSPAPDEKEPGAMAHIHGIGVDPADGILYAATHTGLFRIEGNSAVRVADRWQDTMAFTVAGPGHFLASGHPGAGDSRPPHLGLIESTDAGETWTALALEGRADFHALDLAGKSLYGYDSQSGQLMVTRDRRRFESVAELTLADIAVDQRDNGVLFATTQNGLLRVAAETGQTAFVDAPALVFIDWPRPDLLAGLGPDGAVHVSADGGQSWTSRGTTAGRPAALELIGAQWYAASDQGLFRSSDAGKTWKPVGPRMGRG